MLQRQAQGFRDAPDEPRTAIDTGFRPPSLNPSRLEESTADNETFASDSGNLEVRQPEQAHLRDYRSKFKSTTATKDLSDSETSTSSSTDDRSSFLSSSPTVENLPTPERVVRANNSHLLGVVTNSTPITFSSISIDDDKLPRVATHALLSQERFVDKITTASDIDALTDGFPLPQLTGWKCWREFQYHYASAYRRLWAVVIAVNVAVIAAMISRTQTNPGSFTYGSAATATGANLLVAALMRHEHTVNLLFRLATALPHSTPLSIRRQAAKIYSYGGVHSGAGISAFMWYCFYTVLTVTQFKGSHGESIALAATTAATLLLLVIIVSAAHPSIRKRWHNQWELSHRYSGWTAIGLVWVQTLIIVIAHANQASHSISHTLITTPTFWFLLVITLCLIYPWLRLRHRSISAEKLSPHAIRLHFDDKNLTHCVGYRLSHHPLIENHGFATIPNAKGEKGYSIVVSNAGDWTKDLITNPPKRIWTRGAPTIGVMRIASLFRPIIVVATGSGIGPCLSFLQVFPDYPMRIIWSARFPESTYGAEIMDAVLRADEQAVIIDTKKTGHPDLPALTHAMFKRIAAEAIVIISNPGVTKKVVFEMECRGAPAFGAIFDS